MTTRDQLQAEAAELYPENIDAETGYHIDDWGYSEGQRAAHIRAKTITAEQLLMTAMWDFEMHEPRLAVWEHTHLIVQTRYLDIARRRYNAVGFCVEGEE